MKRKLGIPSGCVRGYTEAGAIRLIREAGFDCVFTGYISVKEVGAIKNECEKQGIELEFLHAPFRVTGNGGSTVYCNEFWRSDLTYLPLCNDIIECIDTAGEVGVDTVMMHVSGGWYAPPITEKGLSRFDAVVEHALRRGVRLGFENTRNIGNLAAIMERYENLPEVGFCYDCGHEHCYTENVRFLDLFGRRTFCTHIHDNLGKDKTDPLLDADYHWLPFEGDIDYREMIDLMDRYDYRGSLMLEVYQYGRFAELRAEEFLAICYERIKRIGDLSKAAE